MTRRLWVATDRALLSFEEPIGPCGVFATDIDCSHGVIPGVLGLLFAKGSVVSSDVKALLHVLSPVDSERAGTYGPARC